MLIFYVYFILILFSIVLYLYGARLSFFSPLKIRILSLCIVVGMIFKYIILIFMYLSQNVKGLYVFEPLYFVNLLLIPVCACLSIYIFARNEKIKFNFIFILVFIFAVTYMFFILRFNAVIEIYNSYGYIINISSWRFDVLIYLLYNIIFLAISIYLMKQKGSIKKGIILAMLSSVFCIFEILLIYLKINLLPQRIIGDFMWTITFVLSLDTIKK